MNRFDDRAATEAYRAAMEALPWRIRERAASDLLFGVDPVFVGLHDETDTDDGRSYRNTSHVCYDFHTTDKRAALVLLEEDEPWVAMHEIGHIVHGTLGLWYEPEPLDDYAETNEMEAFAAAFEAYFTPPEWMPEWRDGWVSRGGLFEWDPETFELFRNLERGDVQFSLEVAA